MIHVTDWEVCDKHERTYPRGGICKECREDWLNQVPEANAVDRLESLETALAEIESVMGEWKSLSRGAPLQDILDARSKLFALFDHNGKYIGGQK